MIVGENGVHSMIQNFVGEFLFNPCPLELSMGVCTNGCHYCFACNRGYKPWSGIESVKRQIRRAEKSDTNVSKLIKQRYPVVLSNRSDPFCKSNQVDTVELVKFLDAIGVPVFFQTKGGELVDMVSSRCKKTLWYFTVSFWDDEKRKRIEPFAPSINERISQIRSVISSGHRVVVGITPMTEQWLPVNEFSILCDKLKTIGVDGVYLQGYHMSSSHKLTEKAKAAMSDVLSDANHRMATDSQFEYYQRCTKYLDGIGLCYYGAGQWRPSDFMESFRDVFENTFPVTMDFIKWVWDSKKTGDYVSFEEYWDVIGCMLPDGMWRARDYIYAVARNLGGKNFTDYMTFKDYLKIVWSDDRHLQSPVRYRLFAFDGIDRDKRKFDNNSGLPLVLVNKNGFERGQRFSEGR
jgi:DNA repair photolyase